MLSQKYYSSIIDKDLIRGP